MESPSNAPLSSVQQDHELHDLRDHPQYDQVLRMVLWDEEKEKIDRRLRTNRVEDHLAHQLYQHARAERIRILRSEYAKKSLWGLLILITSMVAFSICWFGFGFIPHYLLYFCLAGLGIGSWKLIDGIAVHLMAPGKTGSVADAD